MKIRDSKYKDIKSERSSKYLKKGRKTSREKGSKVQTGKRNEGGEVLGG